MKMLGYKTSGILIIDHWTVSCLRSLIFQTADRHSVKSISIVGAGLARKTDTGIFAHPPLIFTGIKTKYASRARSLQRDGRYHSPVHEAVGCCAECVSPRLTTGYHLTDCDTDRRATMISLCLHALPTCIALFLTKFERNRSIHGGVIAISIFDLMTLNAVHVIVCCDRLWDNFHQVWPWTTYRCLNYGVFWCWYVMSCCDLDLWPLDLELLWHFDYHVFRVCTKLMRNPRLSHSVIELRLRRAILGDGAFLRNGFQGCVKSTSPNLART